MVLKLNENHIGDMLALQTQCVDNADLFLPTSRDGYLRAFQFNNFCFGYMENGRLLAFLNASIPSRQGRKNLGRGRLTEEQLDEVGQMNTLLVDRNCRHHGIGRALMQATMDEFRRRNCRHVFVTASPLNRASLELLNRADFHILDIIRLAGRRRYLLYKRMTD